MANAQCLDPITCPDGNCSGCKNGEIWCQDPRCDPQCANCVYDQTADRFGYSVMFLIIVAILLIIFAIILTYGHQTMYYFVPNSQLEEKGYLVPPGPAIYF